MSSLSTAVYFEQKCSAKYVILRKDSLEVGFLRQYC